MELSEIEPAALAEMSLHWYLALPDATAIAQSMRPAESVSEAVKLIQAAKDEAWRIRLEMAKGWNDATMGRVNKLLDAEIGEVPYAVRSIHPLTGPLMEARYPKGIFAKSLEHAASILQKEDAKKKEKAKQAGAKGANEKKERKWMIECVEGYAKWAIRNGVLADSNSIENFKELPGKNIARAHDLLGILITGFKQHRSNDSILEDLKQLRVRRKEKVWETAKTKRGKMKPTYVFKNPTLDAVADCIQILEKSILG